MAYKNRIGKTGGVDMTSLRERKVGSGSDRIILARPIIRVDDERLKQVIGAGLEEKIQAAVFKLGQEARDMARRKAPKKTGALRASIYVSRPGDTPPDGKAVVTKSMTAGYFRAVNSAAGKRGSLSLLDEFDVANPRTQTAKKSAGIVAGRVKINNNMFHTQKALDEEGDFAFTQSLLPFMGGDRNSMYVVVGAAAHYAGFVEFGHSAGGGVQVPPTPFLMPAMEWAAKQLPQRLKEAMEGK